MTREESQVANKCIKRFSTLLVIKKMWFQITMSFHNIYVKLSEIKLSEIPSVYKNMKKKYFVGGS